MVFVFGDCELDLRRGEIRRGGEPRHVEPQVFAVLSYLVEHRDRLVSKQELLDHVWQRRFVTPATLNSRLKAARQAIGDDGKDQQVIRTVRGRGFRFVAPVDERPASSPANTATTLEHPGTRPGQSVGPMAGLELIARSGELDRLTSLLQTARTGERQLALITGEPGIGKSTLAAGFLNRVPQGILTTRGQCLEQRGSGEPYLPVLDAIGRLCRGPGGEEIVRHLVECAPTWMLQFPSLLTPDQVETAQRRAFGATRERMLREIVEALEGVARAVPLVLLLEDLHWSDPSTLDFIVWLMGRSEPARLLILGTFRPSDADAGLRAAVTQVQRSGRCTELPLGRWTESDLRAYWERRDPVPLSNELVRLVHQRTDGNPLFVQTLLTSWSESSALVESDGEWRPKRDVEALAGEIPESLRALVEQRVEQLSAEDQRILEAGSVVGPTFAAALVATMLELEEEEVDTHCHSLARRGQMLRDAGPAEWPDGTQTTQFSFAHHLFWEALYQHIPLSRRTRLHLKVGERLEAAHRAEPAEQASELALHFRLARDDTRAIHYLRLSARQAARRSAHREAITHLKTAIELTPRLPDRAEALRVELELQRMLGAALLLTRGWSDIGAERAYLRARAIAEQVDDPAQLARVLHGMAYLHEIRGDFHHSQSLLETCLRLGDRAPGPYTSIESHELLSCSLFHQGKFEAALRSARTAMAAFDPHNPGDAFVASLGMNAALAAHIWAGLALWCLGYPDQALEPLRGAIEIAGRSELIYMQAASHSQMAQLCQFRRELAPLTEHAEAALDISERQGYPFHYAVALTLRGWARVVQGGVAEGLEQIRRGLAMHEAAGAAIERPYGLGLLADALLRTGRRREGLAVVDEALATIERRARAFFWEPELHRLRGELLVGDGALDEAAASFESALTVASRQGARSLELRAVTSLSRLDQQLGTSSGRRERLRAVFDWFEEGRDTPDLRDAAALLAVP